MENTESEKTETYMTDTEDDAKQRKEQTNKQICKNIDTETIAMGATLQKTDKVKEKQRFYNKEKDGGNADRGKKPNCTK